MKSGIRAVRIPLFFGATCIHALFEDTTGKLFIGSGRGGTCVFDGSAFNEFQLADGVPFTNIQFIV
ncbi:MAG: hypothetical protein KA408_16175 [Flavobacteriales bacterium]|nr:hypothetical protein [Flavobacteriales bacterium]